MKGMKYYFYEYVFRNGENEYVEKALISCHELDNVYEMIKKHHLSDMFGDDTIEEDGVFWSSDYCQAVRIRSVREISKAHFNVLKQYLIYSKVDLKPEKVILT